MALRVSALVCALALLVGSAAWAQSSPSDTRGVVLRVDPQANVIVLDNGRMYRTTATSVVYVDSQPITFSQLRPGQVVMIRGGEAVALENGQYVAVPVAASPPTSPAPSVVIATPPAAAPVGIRQTVYGRVTDVDRNGQVKVETDNDSFKVRLSREAASQIRKGDTVQLDMTVVPPGTPAASPRTR